MQTNPYRKIIIIIAKVNYYFFQTDSVLVRLFAIDTQMVRSKIEHWNSISE